MLKCRGTWVAQLVKRLDLDFGSGHDLRVVRLSPMLGSTLDGEPPSPLPLPLPSPAHALSLSLK